MHFAMAASHLELRVQRTSQGAVFSEENLYNTSQPGKEITTVECTYRRKVRELWITRPIKRTAHVQAFSRQRQEGHHKFKNPDYKVLPYLPWATE